MKINPDNVDTVTYNIIKEAALRDMKLTDEMVAEIADECAKDLRKNSPKDDGEYASGWTVEHKGDLHRVYNAKKPQLTHILEKGTSPRKTKDGKSTGRVKARPHIFKALRKSVINLKQKLKGGQT